MSLTRPVPRRTGAALATVAVGVASALVAPSPAVAAVDDLTLQWGMSQYLDEHLTSQSHTDGASEGAGGVVTFTAGTGTVDAETGEAAVSYQGVAHYGFSVIGQELYGVTFTDPQLLVDGDGNGRIVADVAWSGSAVAAGEATGVELTTFDESDATDGEVAATPHWAGVAEVGSEPFGAGRPVEGKTWSPELVTALPGSVRATFYATGSNPTSDDKKDPAPFVAAVPAAEAAANPSVSITRTGASYAGGVDLTVAGQDFRGVTEPGDNGVYVGVAEAGEFPDTSTPEGQEAFVGAAWVPAAAMPAGSFSVDLDLPTAKLERGTDYALFTWQAHSHSNDSQDTQTAVPIPWRQLRAPSTTAARVTKVPAAGKRGRLRVKVSSDLRPTGKVTIRLKKGQRTVTSWRKPARAAGTVVRTPKLGVGRYTVVAAFPGSPAHRASRDTASFRVGR